MIDRKKIADALREIASFYAPDPDCTNAIYDSLTAIIDELDPPEPQPEPKESPIAPIERPLRNLILEAKEKGVNIRTWYQDLIFTPESLTSYLGNGKYRWWNIGNWELTKRKANMPMPEPATFANVKVGDWVEHNSGGHHPVSKLDKSGFAIDGYEFKWFGYDGYELPDGRIRDSRILRIVPKPEVKVKLTLEGTVKPCSVNTFELCTNEGSNWIGWKELDPDTAALVQALLKAQEE